MIQKEAKKKILFIEIVTGIRRRKRMGRKKRKAISRAEKQSERGRTHTVDICQLVI